MKFYNPKYRCPKCKTESSSLSMRIHFADEDLNKNYGGNFCLVCYAAIIKLNIPELEEIKEV